MTHNILSVDTSDLDEQMDDASENVCPEQPDGAEGMQQVDEHMEGVCVCIH